MHRLPLKKCNRLAITEKGARPRASPPPDELSYEWWLIDPGITTLWTHPHTTNTSDITIDPTNNRGNLVAALRTADAIKDYNLCLGGWYEIGDTRPFTSWISIAMDTPSNTHKYSPFDAFRDEVTTDAWAMKVVWLSYCNSSTTTHDFSYPSIKK